MSAGAAFLAAQPFPPDRFQIEAVEAIDRGESVVVTAPTGAGKTLVAEAAVARALDLGVRAFYTTPIKALSNQKFGDFIAAYGADRVGLLTGDNTINGDAPIVVMTTEVLRNMIYAGSDALDDLGVVILDEVHYLQDPYRGSVWEEVIIHLAQAVSVVSLSATISNPAEFTGWVESRRGPTTLIVESHRPVPLESTYLVSDRYHNFALERYAIFAPDGVRANTRVVNMLRKGKGRRPRFSTPRRVEVAGHLRSEGLLPAIYFIFSRAGCDAAATTVADAGLGLTTAEEREVISATARERTAHLADDDLAVLGFEAWLATLERGVAAHHAGMVPAFKETVEELFSAGVIKLVFATETLALGINMPARAVVLEEFSKFTGESHELLRAGDYTQLTGRAGRRGIDERGTAVVLYSRFVPFSTVVDVAKAGSHPLVSSFNPSYNMTVNLVGNYDRTRAEELLQASFAQYRAEEGRRSIEDRIAALREEVAAYRSAAACELGDVGEYLSGDGGEPRAEAMRMFARSLHEGDVVGIGDGDRWVLLARGWGNAPRLLLLSESGQTRKLRPSDLADSASHLGTMTLEEPITTRDERYLRSTARALRSWRAGADPRPAIAAESGTHPVAFCPDLETHRSFHLRAVKADKELRRLQRRLERRGDDLLERFRALLTVLETAGYVEGWSLTQRGQRLRSVYNELDLVVVESVERGLLADLSPAEFAAVVSAFTYQPRRNDRETVRMLGAVGDRLNAIDAVWAEVVEAEERAGLPQTRQPEPGFSGLAHAWAMGAGLDELFGDGDFAAGDFVRNGRQLLDLMRQLRDGFPAIRGMAAEAIAVVDRGVVATGGRL
jgi:ATP-dependent RNA helicase HelY